MNDSVMVHQVQVRTFSAHNSFLHIASIELELAKPGMAGWFNHALISLTMTALAVEAMANAMGDRLVPRWKDFESSSPIAKLRLVAEHVGLTYAPDEEPWGTVRWLVSFRNRLAHAKPETVTKAKTMEAAGLEVAIDTPFSKLEEEITEANARRALDAVQSLKYSIGEKISPEKRFGLLNDGWTSSVSLAQ